MSLIDLQRKVVALCCAGDAAAPDPAELGDPRIWGLYRELIRNRLRGELKTALRRTYAAAGAEAFERAFAHHLQSDPPRARFFHAIVGDFVRSAVPFFRRDPSVPAYVADLCEYEGALWAVADLPDRLAEPVGEFAFDRRPVLAPALRLLALAHAVHERPSAAGAYAQREVYLCVHRRPEEKRGKTWVLNAVTYALLQRFAPGHAVASAAVQQVAAERGIAVDEKFLDGLCTVLADFIERGIIVGAR